jgi:lysine 2,3-aminomutase
MAGEELDHQRRKLLAAVQDLVSPSSSRTPRGIPPRADERAGLAVPPFPHRLERSLPRPAAPPVHPAPVSLLPDHPKLGLDSLGEMADAPYPGLTHRYVDKALFLPLDTCPVYCRFCTRSYAVGIDTEEVEKVQLNVNAERWQRVRATSHRAPSSRTSSSRAATPTTCAPSQITQIGMALLDIPNVRRMRFATKGRR